MESKNLIYDLFLTNFYLIIRQGSQFLITYLPVEYGKIKMGKLIIETDEVQWLYEVKGDHIDYKPPEAKGSTLMKNTKAGEIRDIQSARQENRPSTTKPQITNVNQVNTKSNLFNVSKLNKEVRDKCKFLNYYKFILISFRKITYQHDFTK